MLTKKELEDIGKDVEACRDRPFICTLHSDLILESIPALLAHIKELEAAHADKRAD